MTKVISAFEAPALLDLHPTLTRYSLFERLTGQPEPKGPIGLATCLSDGAMRFGQAEYGWGTPISKAFTGNSTDGSITMQTRAFMTSDAQGPLLVTFLHLADYLHRMSWGKAGVPPRAFVIQANWNMMLAAQSRMAFLVLSDKRLMLYEVARDEAIIKQLLAGVDAMADAIRTNTPPPIDAVPEAPAPVIAEGAGGEPADLDALVARYRVTRQARAETANSATFADQAAEAAAKALKDALPEGSHHDHDGVRIHHNAKSGRLTEEKIDGTHF